MDKIFSGIRPSGRLHLGNYLGAIKNWVALQDKHECIFGIMTYHAITTPFNPDELRERTYDTALDLLAVGIDPQKSTLITQLPEHLELGWIFGSITSVSRLEHTPTYKEKAAQHPNYMNLGLLSYPTLMAADILIYKAPFVPVGEDQLPHIEFVNEIGQRFNRMFGQTFPRVEALLTSSARIMSLKDPLKKMSKTGDKGIMLSDTSDEVRRKIKTAVTDSGREIIAREDKPALTNLLTIYSEVSNVPIAKLEKKYQGKGYGDFKKDLAEEVVKFLEPIQARRREIEKKKGYVEKIIAEGSQKARTLAQKTLEEVKRKIGIL